MCLFIILATICRIEFFLAGHHPPPDESARGQRASGKEPLRHEDGGPEDPRDQVDPPGHHHVPGPAADFFSLCLLLLFLRLRRRRLEVRPEGALPPGQPRGALREGQGHLLLLLRPGEETPSPPHSYYK